MATGWVVATAQHYGISETSTVKFTGQFAELGTVSLGDLLDETDEVLGMEVRE